jgi:hypothetical protein
MRLLLLASVLAPTIAVAGPLGVKVGMSEKAARALPACRGAQEEPERGMIMCSKQRVAAGELEIKVAELYFAGGRLSWFKYQESLGNERPKVAAALKRSLATLSKEYGTFVVTGSKTDKVGTGTSLLDQAEKAFKSLNETKEGAAPFESAKPPARTSVSGFVKRFRKDEYAGSYLLEISVRSTTAK